MMRQTPGIAMTGNRVWLGAVATGLSVAAFWSLFQAASPAENALVVYCAHDSVYSEAILREFERHTGIQIVVHFDTEATKSVGLVNRLLAEKQNPQCDVFWNNETLGTIRLAQKGILEPYQGPGFDRIPDAYRDRDGLWTGFAARLRVWIVNTDRMTADAEVLQTRIESNDLSSVAMARPMYGTTLVHYALLWSEWGDRKLKLWHRRIRDGGLIEVNGNSTVRDLVAEGKIDCGWTDTDDYFLALDDGKPVQAVPVRSPSGHTICIPNSVAIIKGSPHRQAAERLVDFLLSEKTELALAKSPSRQIPLGRPGNQQLPREVQQLVTWARDGCDLNSLAESRHDCLTWLLREYGE